jgi:hypothetical protein
MSVGAGNNIEPQDLRVAGERLELFVRPDPDEDFSIFAHRTSFPAVPMVAAAWNIRVKGPDFDIEEPRKLLQFNARNLRYFARS